MEKFNFNIKELIFKNFIWKIFSLFIASALWFVVMNINNPVETRTYSLDLQLLNKKVPEENNIVILNKEDIEKVKVSVRVRATRQDLETMGKNFSKTISAYIDLQNFNILSFSDITDAVSTNMNVQLSQGEYNNYEIVNYSPKTVDFKFDKKVSKEKTLTTDLIGKVKSGYVPSNPELEMDSITVYGAKTVLETIDKVVLRLDVSGASSSVSEIVTPIVLDKSGNIIEDVTLSTDKVMVKVTVNLEGTIPILEPTTINEIAPQYYIKSIDYTPKSIEVVGSVEDIKKLSKIELEQIDLSTLTGSKTYYFDIYNFLKDTNLKLKNGSATKIAVTISVDKIIEKEVQIPVSKLNISGYDEKQDYNMGESVKFKIKGPQGVLATVDFQSLNGMVSLSNIGEGKHNLEVSVTVPHGVTIIEKPYIEVEVLDKSKMVNEITTKKVEVTSEDVIETTESEETSEELTTYSEETTEEITKDDFKEVNIDVKENEQEVTTIRKHS